MFAAAAQISTSAGGRYLQQLCKHWAHHLAVEYTPQRGQVVFPRDIRGADYPGDGIATFTAEPNYLGVRIEATSLEQLESLQGVISSHLDRFAFREAPLSFQWSTAGQPPMNQAG
ncbi:MAG: DUF2218 domain-containing protein [Novosphingobium sp.]|nr:DUF2218 domain-containing protein [Novosphingobium sp.]